MDRRREARSGVGRWISARPAAAAALVLITAAPAGATSSYLGLVPGEATRAAVSKTLGDPVATRAGGVNEHRPQDGTGPILVEYRPGGDIADRIEVLFLQPITRTALAKAMALPDAPAGTSVSADGSIVESYGGDALLVLSFAGAGAASGVRSLGYYSPDAFATRFGGGGGTGTGGTGSSGGGAGSGTGTPAGPALPPPPVDVVPPTVRRDPMSCYDVFQWARADEAAAKQKRDVMRRQSAMEIAIAAQKGECSRARTLADAHRRQYR